MTIDEFLEELPSDGWKLEDGLLRRPVKFKGREYDACPITSLSQIHPSPNSWHGVADTLGLEYEDALRIVNAADNPGLCSGATRQLRERLLEKFGLKEWKEDEDGD